MLVKQQNIAMSKIDLESLDESPDNHEAVEFNIVFNEPPSLKWVEEFEIAYRLMPNNIKPPVHIDGDHMRVAFLPRYENELQGFIEFLKSVMRQADEEVAKTEAIVKFGHSDEHIAAFRDVLKRIRVTGE